MLNVYKYIVQFSIVSVQQNLTETHCHRKLLLHIRTITLPLGRVSLRNYARLSFVQTQFMYTQMYSPHSEIQHLGKFESARFKFLWVNADLAKVLQET